MSEKINGKTHVFGVIGNPIEHTQSPLIHQLFYEVTQYNGTYNPFYVQEGMLHKSIEGMKGLSIKGLNVTIPYKIDVMEWLDDIDPTAQIIGAVNTIVPCKDKLIGYNTDWIGLKMACSYHKIPLQGRDCVIIGSGGAARSAVVMCLEENVGSITLLNRTCEKADQLKREMQALKKDIPMYSGTLDQVDLVKSHSIAIQTTSVGMYPQENISPIIDEDFFQKVDFIVDIIYNPKETLFMKKGKEYHIKAVNGLSMLFFQALKAFEYWTDITLTTSQINRCLQRLETIIYHQTKNEKVNVNE